jgi:beta-lactam-binding protein with PASTA domain
MKAYATLISQQQANIALYGDSNLTAGQVITVKIYEPTDINAGKKTDKQLSGNYLISRMRHNITFETEATYEIHATGLKGTNFGSVEEIQADE